MNAAETQPYRLASMHNPAFEAVASAACFSAVEPVPPGTGADPLGWLLDCVVDGLLHCACAHHAVHPDLIDCIEQRVKGRTVAQESLS